MEKTWGNAMLVAYSNVAKISEKLDKQLKIRINRGFGSRHIQDGETAYEYLENMWKITDEKR